MAKILIALMFAAVLSGCAERPIPQALVYHGPKGSTQEELDRALAKCRAQSEMVPRTDGDDVYYVPGRMQKYVANCMRAEGYVQQ